MKNVLIVGSADSKDTIGELPYVLQQAGLRVTLLCSAGLRPFVSSFHDRWIEGSDAAEPLLQQLVALVTATPAAFDWIILGDDHLLRALADAPVEANLKARLGPVGNPAQLDVLGSKIGSARFCAAHGIKAPAFQVCDDRTALAAIALGADADGLTFPFMVKIDRSSGGLGVFACHGWPELEAHAPRFTPWPVLVERFIVGDTVSVEPCFVAGELVAYSSSVIEISLGGAVSTRRRYAPHPALAAQLALIGRQLQLTGFGNFTFMRARADGQYYLVEMDLRPNAWIGYGRKVGVDFAAALRAHFSGGDGLAVQQPRSTTLSLYHREVTYFLTRRHWRGLLYWLRNRQGCWRTIPFYDRPLLRARTAEFLVPEWRKFTGALRGLLRRA